jgi:hypothetical protein
MEHRQHFILSNRQVMRSFNDYYLQLESRIKPDLPLHYALFDFPQSMLTKNSLMKNAVSPVENSFIENVVAETDKLADPYRNVTIYIHGFHHLIHHSYKLDLMASVAKAYCNPAKRSVGKFIFFSWPATQERGIMDDKAHAQGLFLYKNNARLFSELHSRLNEKGIKLNLAAHSFGNRLLNGFLAEADVTEKLFDSVLLFAPDIPFRCMDSTLPGIVLKNKRNSELDGDSPADDVQRLYDLTKLSKIAGEVHTYYCRYDRMLFASTDGELNEFEEQDRQRVENFLCLGNVGGEKIVSPPNVFFHDVEDRLKRNPDFKKLFEDHTHELEKMDEVLNEKEIMYNLKSIGFFLFQKDPWVKLHRYLFESPEVVEHAGQQFRKTILTPRTRSGPNV